MITVAEAWARGLPLSTTLLAGESGLGRVVTWVTALRPRPPGFVGLKGGELALLSTRGLRELDVRLSLTEVIERLADADVAALAVHGEIHPAAPTTADRRGLPLLALPPESDLHAIERQVTRLLLEQRVDLHRRGHEIASQLNELVIEGRDAPDVADRLAQLTGRVVTLEETASGRIHLASPRGQVIDRALLESALRAAQSTALTWANGQSFSASDPPVARFELGEAAPARLVAPLGLPNGLVGLLSVLAPAAQLGEIERLATSRGAAACALAFARERAVLATEDRFQRDVLDELLSDGPLDVEALTGRAVRLGYDFETPHLALLVGLAPPERPRNGQPNGHDLAAALARAAELLTRDPERPPVVAPLRLNGNCLTALLPLAPQVDERAARLTSRRLHETLSTQLGPLTVSVGTSAPRAGVDGLRTAHREAERALTLGSRLFGPGHLTHFGDLGLYRLLFRLHGTPEAEEFLQEVLGLLERYDRQHGADLVPTLETYFAAGASPKETATRLHLHRNTVLYRLQRIGEISGHRLDDPSTCLSLQLALRLRQTVLAGDGE